MAKCAAEANFIQLMDQFSTEVAIDEDFEKDSRVNVWNIQPADVISMLEKGKIPSSMTIDSELVKHRMQELLDGTNAKKLLDLLQENLGNVENRELKILNQVMALDEVIEAISGELPKAATNGIDINRVSTKHGIPNLPLHRVAATLGRKILYREGVRFATDREAVKEAGKAAPDNAGAVSSEYNYYMVGLNALKYLEDTGVVELHESGKPVIRDYMQDGKQRTEVTKDIPALVLNAEKLTKKPADLYNKGTAAHQTYSNEFGKLFSAVRKVTQPSNIVKPGTEHEPGRKVQKDVYEPSRKLKGALGEQKAKPFRIQADLFDFFKAMSGQPGGISGTEYLAKFFKHDEALLEQLFKIKSDSDWDSLVASDDSIRGQNKSSSQPIDDLIEYFEAFKDNPKLFMEKFLGRNARGYDQNTILNGQTSKLMRHALTVGEYTLDTSTQAEDIKFLVSKVADGLKIDPQSLVGVNGNPSEIKKLDVAVDSLAKFNEAKSMASKAANLKLMAKQFKHLDFAELVSTVRAAQDIREGLKSGSVTSTFPVSSDATASGVILTLFEAMGASPDDIEPLFKRMGIIDPEGTVENVIDDPYGLLKESLEEFFGSDFEPGAEGNTKKQEFMHNLFSVLYDDGKGGINYREVSKSPTMTYVAYGQSDVGAEYSIAKNFAERMAENLRTGKDMKNTWALMEQLMPAGHDYKSRQDVQKDPNALNALIKGIKDSGVPKELIALLDKNVKQRYLVDQEILSKAVFDLVANSLKGGDSDFRVYPAAAVIDEDFDRKYTKNHLKKYGIPMTKIFDTMHEVNGQTVLTREQVLRETVMNVSFTHGKDTAAMMHGLRGLPTKYDSAVLTVHDDARSRPDLIREFEGNYVDEVFKIAQNFDILEEVLLAAQAYDTDQNSIDKYTKLLHTVQENKAKRQAILNKEGVAEYAKTSGKIIGDGNGYKDITLPDTPSSAKTDQGTDQERDSEVKENESGTSEVSEQPVNLTALQTLWGNPANRAKPDFNAIGRAMRETAMLNTYSQETRDKINAALKGVKGTGNRLAAVTELLATDADVMKDVAVHGGGNKIKKQLKAVLTAAEELDAKKPESTQDTDVESAEDGFGPTTTSAKYFLKQPLNDVIKNGTAEQILTRLGKKSALIRHFTKHQLATFELGERYAYDNIAKRVTINPDRGYDEATAVRAIEHEIIHSYTSGLLRKYHQDPASVPKKVKNDLQTIRKAMDDIFHQFDRGTLNINEETQKRLWYAKTRKTQYSQMAEFVAIMKGEKVIAQDIKAALTKDKATGLAGAIQRFTDFVLRQLMGIKGKFSPEIDAEELFSTLDQVVVQGFAFRKNEAKLVDAVREANKPTERLLYEEELGFDEEVPKKTHSSPIGAAMDTVDHLNASIARHINDPIVRASGKLYKQLDEFLNERLPVYSRAKQLAQGVYDDSEALQSLVHKITNDGVNNKTKNKVLSEFARIRAEKNDLVSHELQKFKKVTSKLSDEDKTAFYDFTHRMAMQDYFAYVEGTDIAEALKTAQNDAQAAGVNTAAVDKVVLLNTDNKVSKGQAYNIEQLYSPGPVQQAAKRYAVLKSIERMGLDRFEALIANGELMERIKDTVIANEQLIHSANIYGDNTRDSRIQEQFKDDGAVAYKVITKSDMQRYPRLEKDGWQLLRRPTDRAAGIMYRRMIDSTFQEGTFTDIKLQSTDIEVSSTFKDDPNVIETANGFKMILNEEEKDTLGLNRSAEQGLIRTMAHNMAIKESAIIRDALLQNENYRDMSRTSKQDLELVIKDKDRDNPWFLSAIPGTDPDKASLKAYSPEVAAKYMPVPKRLSDHNNFDQKIQYVRKDIAYWLVGSSEKSIGNDPKVKWGIRIAKDLIAGAKIGMITLNPMKIFRDNVSNVAYLGVRGVDPIFMQKQYRQISFEFNDYHKLRGQLIDLKVKAAADPDNAKGHQTRIDKIQKTLKSHPANGLVERGFLNSLGSSLVLNADDPSSGLKADIDTALSAIMKKKDGQHNAVAKQLMRFAKFGVSTENFLEILAPWFGNFKSTKEIETQLEQVAERLKGIRSEEDAVAYMQQFLNSPDSEAVKFGTHMTDLTDVLAKETFYRYLTQHKGMKPKEAELEVIDSFPDYKEGMPTRVKQMSDLGVLMFPSYWLRIQKTIYRMIKDRPVSFGMEEAINEYLDMNASTILDSNLYTKATSYFGIFQAPWNHIGIGSVVPTHIV